MSLPVVALSALPLLGIVGFLAARHRARGRARAAWIAGLADDRDHELRFPGTAAERPVTGRRTLVGRRTARR